eukprot:Lithocolla_globosa_v1_NODE_4438_length_1434_cov_3.484409.p2 type:complete len:128 gc:universal NODE_4438_length_1434_cov_3.484409:1081-698(-)
MELWRLSRQWTAPASTSRVPFTCFRTRLPTGLRKPARARIGSIRALGYGIPLAQDPFPLCAVPRHNGVACQLYRDGTHGSCCRFEFLVPGGPQLSPPPPGPIRPRSYTCCPIFACSPAAAYSGRDCE